MEQFTQLQNIENGVSILREDILQLYDLRTVTEERDAFKGSTVDFLKGWAPMARVSDLFTIPGGVN